MASDRSSPRWARSLNALGRKSWISLDENELLDEASERTGLEDFGDDAFREPLRVLVRSIDDEDALHFIGRALARDEIVNLLENRLGMTEARKRYGAIADVEIRSPVFVTGLPRTGTSILHEVLACDPANRAPLAWEVRHPCPPPEATIHRDDPRIESCATVLDIWNELVPEYRAIHELDARLPVECIMITAHEFRSDHLAATNHALAYGAWLAGADLGPAYRGHRRMLEHLAWKSPGVRWVLKAPSHLAALDHLLATYPDAIIVQTHRDPLKVMGSVLSTLDATARIRAERIDRASLAAWFDGDSCAALLDAASRVRDTNAAKRATFIDVLYADLVRAPIETIRAVYEKAGIRLADPVADRMRAYLAAKPKDKHGVHGYEIDSARADVAAERRRFDAYQRRFGVPAE